MCGSSPFRMGQIKAVIARRVSFWLYRKTRRGDLNVQIGSSLPYEQRDCRARLTWEPKDGALAMTPCSAVWTHGEGRRTKCVYPTTWSVAYGGHRCFRRLWRLIRWWGYFLLTLWGWWDGQLVPQINSRKRPPNTPLPDAGNLLGCSCWR